MKTLKVGENILSTLNKAGYSAYFVGGYVRDKMMGNTPSDIDIATAALPDEVKRLFDHTIDTGLKHGTVTVILDDIPFEVTTYRVEDSYENHRKPKSVRFVNDIEKDLSRRDFTINAMAYHFKDGLIDPFGGKNDIKNKIIRCVGSPLKRFEEDALRMLRCVRFACQTNFEIEEKTLCAIKEKAHLLEFISKERIFTELVKSLTAKYPEHLKVCYETGLFEYFLPEIKACFETPQNTIYHLYNVGEHILKAVCKTPRDKVVRLSALFHDIGKPLCRTTDEFGSDHFKGHEQKSAELANEILKRLKCDNKTIESVCKIISCHRWTKTPSMQSVKEKIIDVGKENFQNLLYLMEADTGAHNLDAVKSRVQAMLEVREIYEEILEKNHPLDFNDLNISGDDLIKMGYSGKEIGEKLNMALCMVLENPNLNSKEILTERFKK